MHHFFYFFEKAIPKGFTNKTIERKLVGRLKILKNNAEVRKHEEIAMVCVFVVKLFVPLRVNEEDERKGLDLTQHGENAYPSFNGLD